MPKPQILKCNAREILDSRGNPTVEASVMLTDGTVGVASVPSGASTGIYEAHEKRDGDPKRYNGKGVLDAVCDICKIISPALSGVYASEQSEIDKMLKAIDGSENKSNLGANATLAVSLASARAAANYYKIPIFKYLGGVDACRLPVPMMNILNGGAHASNNVEIQEFMIMPVGAKSFSEAIRMGSEIYHSLKKLLQSKDLSTAVGDEGGFAPDLESDEQALEIITEAIKKAGYDTDTVKLAIDAAASEWANGKGEYALPKRKENMSADRLIDYWQQLWSDFPLISIEDGLDQRDFEGWKKLTEKLGKDKNKMMLVGDDLFVTNTERLRKGISMDVGNAILIKPNQIGTLTETLDVIHLAKDAGYNFILSHRSGETEDTTLADIAVAVNAPFIKTGAPCRGERTAKYNRLLRIECALNSSAKYGTF
jgi:enolase